MLLFVSGSYPDNQEGIAAGAKVILDSFINQIAEENVLLLTTDVPIISDRIDENSKCKYELLPNWKIKIRNIQKFYSLIKSNHVKVIHMEYPGDLYGKTFLASFLPLLVKLYNLFHRSHIQIFVRLHEFSRARFLRKVAIIPIVLFADGIYIPALKDRNIISRIAGKRVHLTVIGTNIAVTDSEPVETSTVTVSYFGSVYPGKGIEKMLIIWKKIHELDSDCKFRFKIIGDIGIETDNHFCEYHKKVWNWIKEYDLLDYIEVTGYISDERVSEEISKTQIATLFYEDGLTLRRGSFLAYLAHGIPIVTSKGDDEASRLFQGHDGIVMSDDEEQIISSIMKYSKLDLNDRNQIRQDNKQLSKHFSWDEIAKTFIKEYGLLDES